MVVVEAGVGMLLMGRMVERLQQLQKIKRFKLAVSVGCKVGALIGNTENTPLLDAFKKADMVRVHDKGNTVNLHRMRRD